MENLHKRIRELRKAERLSQAELGERVGIGRVGITKLEQGKRPVSVEEARALADALGVSLMFLLEGESQPEADEEEGVELRFEVTVKLLPSRETSVPSHAPLDPFLEYVRQVPELQRAYDEAVADDPAIAERMRVSWLRRKKEREAEESSGLRQVRETNAAIIEKAHEKRVEAHQAATEKRRKR
jgi:transcriptional regulator with XRE-family HTH domain